MKCLLLCLLLADCGGGGSAVQNVVRIFGDSTCYGVAFDGAYHRVSNPWPSYISFPVINSCIGGQALQDVDMASIAKDGATVELFADGINDAFLYSPEVYADLLRKAVSVSRAAGKTVIFQTPNPTYEARVTALAQVMRNVAAELNVPVIDQDRHLRETYSDLSFAGDQMHPSQPAYTVMGMFSQSRLQEILK